LSPITKKLVDFNARLIFGNKSYPSYIENLSNEDICLLVSQSIPLNKSFKGSECTLEFSNPSGEKMNLNCTVKCMYKTPPFGLTNSMVMEVNGPSAQYKKLLDAL
jgi:hypothetical protein